MSTYKKLHRQDTYITAYSAQKQWAASGSADDSAIQTNYDEYGIEKIIGVSGSVADLTNPIFDYTTPSNTIRNKTYNYRSAKHLYYSLLDPDTSQLSGSYENYFQSSYNPSGSRVFTDEVFIYSIPRAVFGTHIRPGSVKLTPNADDRYVLDGYAVDTQTTSSLVKDAGWIAGDETTYLVGSPDPVSLTGSFNQFVEHTDYLFGSDGANLGEDYLEKECQYVEEFIPDPGEYLEVGLLETVQTSTIIDDGEGNLFLKNSVPRQYVGQVIYPHGQIILTRKVVANYLNNFINPKIEWESNHPIYTHTYHCKLKSSEFNYTVNVSSLDNETGELKENLQVEDFTPYITTVGLYNDVNQLIAVAKLGKPIPKSSDNDMTIVVKLDM